MSPSDPGSPADRGTESDRGSESDRRTESDRGPKPPAELLTVLSGPSGVGKSSLVTVVQASYPGVWVSVSVTTRSPRPGETDGVQYHFVDRSAYDRLVADGALLEHAEFAGNCYGTPAEPVRERLAAGLPALLEIELQGARQVRRVMPEARLVFLAPPSVAELEQRLTGRATEVDAVRQRRLAQAQVELAAQEEFDVVIVNDTVERAAAELVRWLQPPGPPGPVSPTLS